MSRAGPRAAGDLRGLRRDPAVRAIALEWRRLTGGKRRGIDTCRRTVIAVSGGADSSALAIALCAAVSGPRGLFVLAHVVHDLRPREAALADRDAAAELARRLDVPFAEAEVEVQAVDGNLEGEARRLRYRALADIADRDGCGFVATAHQAEDQLETLLMGLLRGAGPDGLRGVRPTRRLSRDIEVIRPALSVPRDELRRICGDFGWEWQQDTTNTDTSRLRSALRHRVLPILEELRPGAAARAGRTSKLLGEASDLVQREAGRLLEHASGREGNVLELERRRLREQPDAVLGALLHRAALGVRGVTGQDKLGGSVLDPILEAIRDDSTDPRTFVAGGVEVRVTARAVTIRRCS
jgi:tRNA(Ile)-lysidine synthase